MDGKETFIRSIELNSLDSLTSENKCLNIHQKFIGDVGCVVWDAALVLAKYLFTPKGRSHVKGKNILELGSGTGIVGLASIVAGAECALLTDLPEFIPLMELNIKENCNLLCNDYTSNTKAQVLRWGNKDDIEQTLTFFKSSTIKSESGVLTKQCIIIADCIYYKEGMINLYNTTVSLINNSDTDTTVLFSYEHRETGDKVKLITDFFGLLHSNSNLAIEKVQFEDLDEEYRCDDIFVFIMRKNNES